MEYLEEKGDYRLDDGLKGAYVGMFMILTPTTLVLLLYGLF
jgi:hypothetical protein